MTDPTLDPERLAALLDGRLSPAERDEVVRRLGTSAEALEIHADAAAVLRELENEGMRPPTALPVAAADARPSAGETKAWRWTRSSSIRLALAAGLVFVAIVPLVMRTTGTTGPTDTVRTTRAMPAESGTPAVAALSSANGGLPSGWNGQPWSSVRGSEAPITPAARAVRLGALFTDLELAIRARDSAGTAALAGAAAVLLADLPATGPAASAFRGIAARAADGVADGLTRLAVADAATTPLLDSAALAQGRWLEAARVAAARGDAAFFRNAASVRMAEATLSADDRAMVARAVASSPPGAAPWSDIENRLSTSLARLGR